MTILADEASEDYSNKSKTIRSGTFGTRDDGTEYNNQVTSVSRELKDHWYHSQASKAVYTEEKYEVVIYPGDPEDPDNLEFIVPILEVTKKVNSGSTEVDFKQDTEFLTITASIFDTKYSPTVQDIEFDRVAEGKTTVTHLAHFLNHDIQWDFRK